MFSSAIEERPNINHSPVIDFTEITPEPFSKKIFPDNTTIETFSLTGAVLDPDNDPLRYIWFFDYNSLHEEYIFQQGINADSVNITACKFKEVEAGTYQLMVIITDRDYFYSIDKGFEFNGNWIPITWEIVFKEACEK